MERFTQIPIIFLLIFHVTACNQLAEYYYNKGVKQFDSNYYFDALDNFNKAIELNPDYAEAFKKKGDLNFFLAANQDNAISAGMYYGHAINDFDKAIKINPQYGFDADIYYKRGIAKAGCFPCEYTHADVLIDIDKAIELDPNESRAYLVRGTLNESQEKAIQDFSKAIELDPKNGGAYYYRGKAKGELGDHRGAIMDLKKVVDLKSKFTANAHLYMGVSKMELGDYKGAIEDYNNAIVISTNLSNYELGQAYGKRGEAKYELAGGGIEDCKIAHQNGYNCGTKYYNDAMYKTLIASIKKESPEKAQEESIKYYNKAIELNPNYVEAYESRGLKKYELGDYRGAINDYNKAIAIVSSEDKSFHYKLGRMYTWRGLAMLKNDQKDSGCLDLSKAGEIGYESLGANLGNDILSDPYELLKKYCN